MRDQRSIEWLEDEIADWLPLICTTFETIDTDAELTDECKKLLKRVFIEITLPPSIQEAAREYFLDEPINAESTT